MEASAGSFEVTLTHATDARGRTWKDRIHPQDLVVIQMMNYDGTVGVHGRGEMHTVMIGLVDAISEVTAMNSRGQPQRSIRVRGRDMGKLFLNGIVTYWSFLGATMLGARNFLDPTQLNDQPHRVIERLLEEIFERFVRVQFRFRGVYEQFFNMLAYQLTSYGTEIPAGLDYQFLGGEGNFWSFFVKVASPPFHELFVDTRRVRDLIRKPLPEGVVTAKLIDPESGTVTDPSVKMTGKEEEDDVLIKEPATEMGQDHSVPVLIMRPPPFPFRFPDPSVLGAFSPLKGVSEVTFDHGGWKGLVRHEVGDGDQLPGLVDEELTTSDAEQFNVYLVFPKYQGLNEQQYLLMVPPLIDERRFQRYGFKLFMPSVTLLKQQSVQDGNDPWIGFYHHLAWRLASWNVLNDRFISGYQTYRLLPHVHIGQRLLDHSSWRGGVGGGSPAAREFYIESVSHQFRQHERATTTLGLTRGLLASEYEHIEDLIRSEPLIVPKHAGEIVDVWRQIVNLGTHPPA